MVGKIHRLRFLKFLFGFRVFFSEYLILTVYYFQLESGRKKKKSLILILNIPNSIWKEKQKFS